MNFDLSEEQRLFEDSVERFAAPLDTPGRRQLRGATEGYSLDRWQELAGIGLLALPVSEEGGGIGGSPIDLAIVATAFGRAVAPDPWLENGVIPALLLAKAKRAGELAGVVSGQQFFAFAFAERRQRFNIVARAVTARQRGEDYVLQGEKTFVLGGALADHFIVTADCDGETRLFLVDANQAGVIRHPYRLVDGSVACELRLADVLLRRDAKLSLDLPDLHQIVAQARLLAAAELQGLAQRLFDETLGYVKQREQFGVAIGTFQALQHRLVECYAALEQARSAVYRAALSDGGEESFIRSAAGAKAFVSAQADLIAREAVQMHGGMGITDELIVGHAVKRVLLLGRLLGDDDAVLTEYAEAA